MNEEQEAKLDELLRFFSRAREAIEKSADVQPELSVRLSLNDFRGKKRVPGSPQKKRGTGLESIYTSIDTKEITYFEDVLNGIYNATGIKLRISDFLRGIVNDFMDRYSVEEALEFMNKSKSKFIVR